MKVYWRYTCDFGHEWVLYRDEDVAESESDSYCPEGHPAVTLIKERPVDEVQITFRPAARIVDPVKFQVIMKGRYSLVLTDINEMQQLVSKQSFRWHEVVQLAAMFRGLSWSDTADLWRRKQL